MSNLSEYIDGEIKLKKLMSKASETQATRNGTAYSNQKAIKLDPLRTLEANESLPKIVKFGTNSE